MEFGGRFFTNKTHKNMPEIEQVDSLPKIILV